MSQKVMFPIWSLDFRLIKAETEKCDLWDWLLTSGDSLLPQDTQWTLNPVSLSPSRPQFLGPCCQSADLELSQRMRKQIWENCTSASFRYVREKPLGLRKIIGKTVSVSTSHKACLLLILLQNTRKSTQIPFAWLVPNGIRQGRNVSLDYLIPELWQTLIQSCYWRWLGEAARLLCRLGFWLCLFRLRTDENMVLQPGTLHLCSWRRCTVL